MLLRLLVTATLLFTVPVWSGLVEVVAAAKPAVVAIGLYRPLSSPRFDFRGTGFVINDGRTVATNAHVLPDDATAMDQLALQISGERGAGQDGGLEVRSLTLLQLDRTHDLALLQFSGAPLPALALDPADSVREGQAAAFIGFPIGGMLGFSPVTHRATISSITPIALPPPNARQLDAGAVSRLRAARFDIYQLDGIAYPGNSGGPLLDSDSGQVLGIVNMVLVKNSRESLLSHPSGISYAIPVRYLRALLIRP
jgi:S1-C subfamily serine protease